MIENEDRNSVFIENHDNPRSVSRYADDRDEWRVKGAKLLVYQGEEIGIRNAPISWQMEEFKDIETINYWKKCQDLYQENPDRLAHGRKIINMKARDHARTPMQ